MKSAIWHLARKGGVKCINDLIYIETHEVLKIFLENVICNAVVYTSRAHSEEDDSYHVAF
ncbi:Histone H [Trema orientale]|uniref:Histone H n=1 Tax=Trema orientale TaxID=63057 RepID=A0A2P5FPB2_TREOI|nr:Histone H [Trema orientale]